MDKVYIIIWGNGTDKIYYVDEIAFKTKPEAQTYVNIESIQPENDGFIGEVKEIEIQ